MKPLLFASIFTLFGLANLPLQAGAEILFKEEFTNTTKADSSLSTVSWTAYRGSQAETIDNSLSSSSVPYIPYSIGSDGQYGFLSPGPIERTSLLVITTKIQGSNINITDVSTITFEQRNNRTDNNVRLAIQVNSEWYVTTQVYNSSSNTVWATAEINLADATWNRLNFTPDSTLLMDAPASLPLSGVITGIGFFSTSAQNAMRIDTLSVHSIPEASTMALAGACVATVILFRSKFEFHR